MQWMERKSLEIMHTRAVKTLQKSTSERCPAGTYCSAFCIMRWQAHNLKKPLKRRLHISIILEPIKKRVAAAKKALGTASHVVKRYLTSKQLLPDDEYREGFPITYSVLFCEALNFLG